MTTYLTIAEAALATGLTVHTLRYYEQIGLIDPVPRRSGQRVYGEHELALLRFVVHMRATGMSMRQLAKFFKLDVGYIHRVLTKADIKSTPQPANLSSAA